MNKVVGVVICLVVNIIKLKECLIAYLAAAERGCTDKQRTCVLAVGQFVELVLLLVIYLSLDTGQWVAKGFIIDTGRSKEAGTAYL